VYILVSSLFRRGLDMSRRNDRNDEARRIAKEMPGCSNRDSEALYGISDSEKWLRRAGAKLLRYSFRLLRSM
jgi:hypothetical protein